MFFTWKLNEIGRNTKHILLIPFLVMLIFHRFFTVYSWLCMHFIMYTVIQLQLTCLMDEMNNALVLLCKFQNVQTEYSYETSWTIFAYTNLDWLCDQIMYVCVLYLFLFILPSINMWYTGWYRACLWVEKTNFVRMKNPLKSTFKWNIKNAILKHHYLCNCLRCCDVFVINAANHLLQFN